MGKLDKLKKTTGDVKNRIQTIISKTECYNLLDGVQEKIKRVRDPTEKPKQDMTDPDISVFECDLCFDKARKGQITQCPFCGRWICQERCYTDEEGACRSCTSVIRLQRESMIHMKEIILALEPENGAVHASAGEKRDVDKRKGKSPKAT